MKLLVKKFYNCHIQSLSSIIEKEEKKAVYKTKEPKSQSKKKTKWSVPRQDDNMDNLLKTTAKLRKMKAKESGKIRRKSSSMTMVHPPILDGFRESPTPRAA